jgi:hypothetical protein
LLDVVRLFTNPKRVNSDPVDLLDYPLLWLSDHDVFSIRDACEGVQIFGGIGSGKTSGSGRTFATRFLESGFGGLVLTAKPDETETWVKYARDTGRSRDLILVNPQNRWSFDFMDYEMNRPGLGTGLTENLVNLFSVIIEVSERGKGSEKEAFWRNEQRKLLRNAIDLLRLARSPVRLGNIYQVIMSAARSPEEFEEDEWRMNSYCLEQLAAVENLIDLGALPQEEYPDWVMCGSYWAKEFPQMSDRTRATVISIFTGMADAFLRGLLPRIFDRPSNFTPEDTLDGKIIILDLPVKMYHEVGTYAQVLFKYCWQRAIERRSISSDSRPVFLWIDEAQHFVNEHDVGFQTTARSSRACTILLTQNLPNYFYTLGGGDRVKALVDSLLGNLTTKIFHNNTCAATNQYGADLFSKEWQNKYSSSASQSQQGTQMGTSTSESLEYSVLPREFTGLAKGGPQNHGQVEAIIHQGGKTFVSSGTNALKTCFLQFDNAQPSPVANVSSRIKSFARALARRCGWPHR